MGHAHPPTNRNKAFAFGVALNVTPVETVGHPFDPRVHEALESVERTDLPDHQVIDEIRRGYRIKERLLRPALVRISVNPNLSEA